MSLSNLRPIKIKEEFKYDYFLKLKAIYDAEYLVLQAEEALQKFLSENKIWCNSQTELVLDAGVIWDNLDLKNLTNSIGEFQ